MGSTSSTVSNSSVIQNPQEVMNIKPIDNYHLEIDYSDQSQLYLTPITPYTVYSSRILNSPKVLYDVRIHDSKRLKKKIKKLSQHEQRPQCCQFIDTLNKYKYARGFSKIAPIKLNSVDCYCEICHCNFQISYNDHRKSKFHYIVESESKITKCLPKIYPCDDLIDSDATSYINDSLSLSDDS